MSTPPNNQQQLKPEEHLQLRAAWLYYIESLTQHEIACRLGVSRVKVNRLLAQSRKAGMVQITIKTPANAFPEVEQQLCQKYQLRDAVVVLESGDGEVLYRILAQAAADWLTPRLAPKLKIGFSLGRTLSYLPLAFSPSKKVDCSFHELIGGLSDSRTGIESYSVIARMAEIAGGKACFLHVPTLVSNQETRSILIKERTIAEAFEAVRQCHIILSSIGDMTRSALLYQHGYLTDGDMADLAARGAVGDVLGHFIDAEGRQVASFIDERLMSISLDDLCRIPYRVLVGGGAAKSGPMRASLKGALFNVVITDILTAQMLLQN